MDHTRPMDCASYPFFLSGGLQFGRSSGILGPSPWLRPLESIAPPAMFPQGHEAPEEILSSMLAAKYARPEVPLPAQFSVPYAQGNLRDDGPVPTTPSPGYTDVPYPHPRPPRPPGVVLQCPPRSSPEYYQFPKQQVKAKIGQGEIVHWLADLMKDQKRISQFVTFDKTPFKVPHMSPLHIYKMEASSSQELETLPKFLAYPYGDKPTYVNEWRTFITYLQEKDQIAAIRFEGWELLFNPPSEKPPHCGICVYVSYRRSPSPGVHSLSEGRIPTPWDRRYAGTPRSSARERDPTPQASAQLPQPEGQQTPTAAATFSAQMHPNYLKTLSQNHASWLFGGIAELIDNARDASATRLEISVEMGSLKGQETQIPMLQLADNGKGMDHKDICRMLSFGHKHAEEENQDQIGCFGVGFKSGSMRIGNDVVVLTQRKESRSIGFLSSSYNNGKDVLEIPIVTWVSKAGRMEYNKEAQSEEQAKKNLKAIQEHSPFTKFKLGVEFEKISGTGTRIYVYNLEKWGSEYRLKWDGKDEDHNDIIITSKRPRTRPGQTSQKVPLDYSLRAYMEVLFLLPKMKVYIQNTVVKTRRLDESLIRRRRRQITVQGKQVSVTLGFCPKEKELGNCGVFLYWHGRLIEAYKRVGRMIHSADIGRGVIGVIDTTAIWEGSGRGGVLNTKQGFEDSEAYAELEKKLAKEVHDYWEDEFEKLEKVKDEEGLIPDRGWAQCDKCLKWRTLPSTFSTDDLPEEWFCYLPPFRGRCSMPEEVSTDVVTVKVENGPATDSEITLDRSSPDRGNTSTVRPDTEGDSPQPTPRRRLVKKSEKRLAVKAVKPESPPAKRGKRSL